MSLTSENKNNPEIISTQLNRYRTVCHFPGGINCTNCYITNKAPCDDCSTLDYETKHNDISWEEFKTLVEKHKIIRVCTKIPESYNEYCDLYDMYHDISDSESDI